MRVRAAAVDPNPMDSAAIMMAAEAVNSTEPIRSMFIGYSFLIDHSLFAHPIAASCAQKPLPAAARDGGSSVNHTFSIMRVYTPFIVKEFICFAPLYATFGGTAARLAKRVCLVL